VRTRHLATSAVVIANIGGALVVLALGVLILPDPRHVAHLRPTTVRWINVGVLLGYLTVAIGVGTAAGLRSFRPVREPFRTDRDLTEDEQRLVLRGPLRMMRVHAALWGNASVGWAALNLLFSPLLAFKLGLTCLLGGLTTSTIVYLLTERLFRTAVTSSLRT